MNLIGGINYYQGDEVAKVEGEKLTQKISKTGSYYGAGIKIPISNIDLFADLIINKFVDESELGNFEVGLRYRFDEK